MGRLARGGPYRFLARPGRPFSAGVVAEPGFEILRVRFDPPIPLEAGGYEAMEKAAAERGASPSAICAVELRSPKPFDSAGFDAFNRGYVERLAAWGLRHGDSMGPARTNVAPVHNPPAEVCVAAVCLAAPARAPKGSWFVVSGETDDRDTPDLDGKWDGIVHELEARLDALGVAWDAATEVVVYADDETLHAFAPRIHALGGKARGFPSLPPVDVYTMEIDVRNVVPPEPRSLDDLARLDPSDLMALYRAARTPALADLDGRLTGRMLAVPRAQEPHVRDWLERFARSAAMPWQGKTFTHETEGHGHGVNRLLGERVNWFHFETSVAPSRAGDFDAVQLDYSHDGNPPVVRDVKDEVREVGPGLWLGLAYLELKDGDHLGCFFGIARPD